MTPSRFEELLERWQEGDASASQLAEFETILRSDPRYRRALVESVLLEVDLFRKYAEVASAALPSSLDPAHEQVASPAPKRRSLESWAAVLVAGISILAVAYLFLRFPPREASHRVAAGHLWVEGAPARASKRGDVFEVRGAAPARIDFQDGSRLALAPESAGTYRGDRDFELARGSGTFQVMPGPEPFRVETPLGTVRTEVGTFSVSLQTATDANRALSFAVTVASGSVEVDYSGAPHRLGAGESVTYGLPAGRASALEKLIRQAAFDLSEGIEKALLAAPGTAIEAGIEGGSGRVIYSIEVAQGVQVREIELDAKTGAVVGDEIEDEDRSKLVAASKRSLPDALRAALEKVPGTAVHVKAELRDERAQATVGILREGRFFMVIVDLETGAVTEVTAVVDGTEEGENR
ncbi:MAG: PepSY domain-containing protein [Planctomycetes bacterium]|nr:PepSY domain-containing protein [Planctomycetota bacterium]